jgi:hypothetical protein
MQNKPNLLNAQINVNKVLTKDYGNVRLGGRGKNKANQTQFQTQLLSAPKTPQFLRATCTFGARIPSWFFPNYSIDLTLLRWYFIIFIFGV